MNNNKEVIGRGKEEENNTGNEESRKQEEQKRKRGRRKKNEVQEQYEPKDQNKYFIDVSKNKEQRELIQNILNQANNKNYGREIILKDLVLIALPKVTVKEIEKLQESSLSEMERVSMALDEYNKKAEVKLTLGEFLVKKLAL
ncbi:MAG: hypothetical protein ACK41T_02485 [Pseudobdellovibrio sp.]